MRVQACGDCHLMNFGAFATPALRKAVQAGEVEVVIEPA